MVGGASLAALGALLGGVLSLAMFPVATWSPIGIIILATTEEISRGTLLYLFVSRRGNRLIQRAIFGAVFGWLELLIRLYPDIRWCEEKLSPLSCLDGIPYLGISWAEGILFHIFISTVNYRDSTTTRKLILAIIAASLIHATFNLIKLSEV